MRGAAMDIRNLSKQVFLAALLAALALVATVAQAANDPASPAFVQKRLEGLTLGAEDPIDLRNGSFQHRVDIDVPPFHEIAPELSLGFESSGSNGFVGVGWTLSGFSVIEQMSSRSHGTRRCTADDVYTLDGEPLLACTEFGGTHCTKAQTFQRIRFDVAAEQWTIWEKNGKRRTYTKIFQVPFGMPNASCP